MQENEQRKTKGKADEFDKNIGDMVRKIRLSKGVSQQDLAEKVGVTFQQMQKYEKGVNRISASKLYQLSNALEFNVSNLFEALEGKYNNDYNSSLIFNINDRNTIELIALFQKIDDPELKSSLIKVIRGLFSEGR